MIDGENSTITSHVDINVTMNHWLIAVNGDATMSQLFADTMFEPMFTKSYDIENRIESITWTSPSGKLFQLDDTGQKCEWSFSMTIERNRPNLA
jgi:hypothetical protein